MIGGEPPSYRDIMRLYTQARSCKSEVLSDAGSSTEGVVIPSECGNAPCPSDRNMSLPPGMRELGDAGKHTDSPMDHAEPDVGFNPARLDKVKCRYSNHAALKARHRLWTHPRNPDELRGEQMPPRHSGASALGLRPSCRGRPREALSILPKPEALPDRSVLSTHLSRTMFQIGQN